MPPRHSHFNIHTASWSVLQPRATNPTVPRWMHAALWSESCLLIFGGCSNEACLEDTRASFDEQSTTVQWTSCGSSLGNAPDAPGPCPRAKHVVWETTSVEENATGEEGASLVPVEPPSKYIVLYGGSVWPKYPKRETPPAADYNGPKHVPTFWRRRKTILPLPPPTNAQA